MDLGGRPDDLAQAVVVESHVGPRGGEVVELLGVDVGDLLEVPPVDEVAGGGAGGVAGVVPALEGGDDDRRLQRGPGRPADVDHRSTVPSGTVRSSGATTPVMLRRLTLVIALVAAPSWWASASPALAHVELEPERGDGRRDRDAHVPRRLRRRRHHRPRRAAAGGRVGGRGAREGGLDVDAATTTERTVTWSGGLGGGGRGRSRWSVALPDDDRRGAVPGDPADHGGRGRLDRRGGGRGRTTANPAPRLTLVADPNATTTTTAATTTTEDVTTTTADLPGTTVEAANEGDGDSAAPWLIGAGIAAIAGDRDRRAGSSSADADRRAEADADGGQRRRPRPEPH